MPTFVDILESSTKPVWESIHGHPFVTGIGSGDLARQKFEFYLKQDYLYLIDFSKVYALAVAKAEALSDMQYFGTLLHETLDTEMDLHRRICAQFEITPEDLEATEAAFVTHAYTSFLLRTCYEENLAGIIAVLLPCAKGYADIALRLQSQGLPGTPHYRDWIETYASEAFVGFAHWLRDKMNDFGGDASAAAQERWRNLYSTSARFEFSFFEMGWQQEVWPGLKA